jgi:hypothetical protein
VPADTEGLREDCLDDDTVEDAEARWNGQSGFRAKNRNAVIWKEESDTAGTLLETPEETLEEASGFL